MTPVRLAGVRGQLAIYDWLVKASGGQEPLPQRPDLPQGDSKPITQLVADVSAEDRQESQDAKQRLVLLGKEAVPAIIEAIEQGADIEPFYEVFSNMGPAAVGALPLLKSKLTDKDQVLSSMLTMQRMHPTYIDALDDETKEKAATTLYDFILNPEADVMAAFAFRMLMVLGEPAEDAIVKLLQRPAAQIRKQSARNLRNSPFTTPRLRDALSKLAQHDPHAETRAAAAAALKVMGRVR